MTEAKGQSHSKTDDSSKATKLKLNTDQGPLQKMACAKGVHLRLVVNCVFNAFLCLTTIVLNIITIQAIRKTSSLPKTLKTLLLSLAVSDLGVGLLVQPLYVAILVMEIGLQSVFNPEKSIGLGFQEIQLEKMTLNINAI